MLQFRIVTRGYTNAPTRLSLAASEPIVNFHRYMDAIIEDVAGEERTRWYHHVAVAHGWWEVCVDSTHLLLNCRFHLTAHGSSFTIAADRELYRRYYDAAAEELLTRVNTALVEGLPL